ncbi:MAG: PEP-CTERM sorting domain-containing protein [Gammaproteobacteria bacterium]|nr:PEP-CTERM sorting domain-containing protein [Gammaproteobacteria bacterium]
MAFLALGEVATEVGNDRWILGDLVDETLSDLPFLGFISDELFGSFSFFHAGEISDITRTCEEFYLDTLILAETPVSVPEPPELLILMTGLVGMMVAIRIRRS